MNSHLSVKEQIKKVTIHVRGDRKTGKSLLVRLMSGFNFLPDYEPTQLTQSTLIQWAKCKGGEKISFTLLDVVSPNGRLASLNTSAPKIHGVIVLYDPRNTESMVYAQDVIKSTPSGVPIALMTNFQDQITTDMHPQLHQFADRIYHIQSSLKTNLGLKQLAEWLEYPYLFNICSVYRTLLGSTDREITRIRTLFKPDQKQIIPTFDLQSSKSKSSGSFHEDTYQSWIEGNDEIPAPAPRNPSPNSLSNQKNNPTNNNFQNGGLNVPWSEVGPGKTGGLMPNRPAPPEPKKQEIDPMTEALMAGIIESAQKAPGIRGLDEIEDEDASPNPNISGLYQDSPLSNISLFNPPQNSRRSQNSGRPRTPNSNPNSNPNSEAATQNPSSGERSHREHDHEHGGSGRRRHHHRTKHSTDSSSSNYGGAPNLSNFPANLPTDLPNMSTVPKMASKQTAPSRPVQNPGGPSAAGFSVGNFGGSVIGNQMRNLPEFRPIATFNMPTAPSAATPNSGNGDYEAL